MTPIELVEKIKQVVYESTLRGCLSLMQKPPGREPSAQLQALSRWFNRLSESDKTKVLDAVKLASRSSVSYMLCVLDGVVQVDDSENQGKLELRYSKDGESQLLNDPNAELLHDIFNQMVPPE